MAEYYQEPFTDEERSLLSRFFTNVDGPVFALVNLPEVVKGALFARYSRSHKSARRLFLDEFLAEPEVGIQALASRLSEHDPLVSLKRAEQLYDRVFFEYGDDSVAQMGGAHLACEQASNILSKVLEWGRLAGYLEQSTRYVAYDDLLGGRYRYFNPAEIAESELRGDYSAYMEYLFALYSELLASLIADLSEEFPRHDDDPKWVWRASIRAKACDVLRGLLPASTLANVGIYATGQAYEMALVRMRAHPLREVTEYSDLMLTELRKVIPSFLRRVDLPDRGDRWSGYLADVESRLAATVDELVSDEPKPRPAVTLVDFDPEAEIKLVAAALYARTELPDDQLLELARQLSREEQVQVLAAFVGDRANRRHKPGRAMERSFYRFDVLCDYGAFRDLQRHRMMTIEWQRLGTRLGYDTPAEIERRGLAGRWHEAMERGGELYERTRSALGPDVASYVVPLAYNIRFVMELNARQAFHLIELRSQPAGHPAYRKICHDMHRLIRGEAGHQLIAEAMSYVDYSAPELERLEGERKAETKRASI
ncbi:MAG: FAD-dependent thymidylate synthase [Acidimicrobiia bacterium]